MDAVWLARDAVVVHGPEATDYLQGQLSQDVTAVEAEGSAWSWVLQPSGKVDALVRVTRTADAWVLDTDAGFGAPLVARLNRFKLRTKVDIDAPAWRCLGLRGDDADPTGVNFEVAADAAWGPSGPAAEPPRAGWQGPSGPAPSPTDAGPPGAGWQRPIRGVDLFGPDPAVPPGATPVEAADYEATRILAGLPRMGAELTERTIPAETGLVARTVSFTKGCYTGQELVARIDSRGSHVPRHLRLLRAAGPIEVGAELSAGGKVVGSVTSFAHTGKEGWVGLGYVARSVIPPAPVDGPDGVEVMVEELS